MTEVKQKQGIVVSLADVPIRIISDYDDLFSEFLHEFLTDQKVTYTLEIRKEDVDHERMMNTGKRATENSLAILALYRKTAELLIQENILLIHASAISYENDGILFLAKSGTGKSTHTQNWMKLFPDKVTVVNGDKPLVKITGQGANVYGTPWSGKEKWYSNTSVKIKAVCAIVRDRQNYTEEVSSGDFFPYLIQQTYVSKDQNRYQKELDLLSKLSSMVNFYKIHCNMEIESAEKAWSAIYDNEFIYYKMTDGEA
ncbi:MAG: hypothetical protein IKG15_06285 [Solobacterium sp.]|nr:hypothetical protein [Solobacterium sp.]